MNDKAISDCSAPLLYIWPKPETILQEAVSRLWSSLTVAGYSNVEVLLIKAMTNTVNIIQQVEVHALECKITHVRDRCNL